MKKINIPKQFLIQEYSENKKTQPQIAKIYGCNRSVIKRNLIEYGIKIRTKSEASKIRLKNPENHPMFGVCREGKLNGNYIDGRTNKIYYCKEPNCKNKISYSNWKVGKRRCRSCSKKGPSNSSYINGKGYEPYTKEFTLQLKEKIRKRDNYKCQGKDCSITQEEHFLIYGRDIEIHHIDYDKMNCKEDNLITLCKQCNIRANYNRTYWKKYFKNKLIGVKI